MAFRTQNEAYPQKGVLQLLGRSDARRRAGRTTPLLSEFFEGDAGTGREGEGKPGDRRHERVDQLEARIGIAALGR